MTCITDYNPDWPGHFNRIADLLPPKLPADCRIHHVGSTSVPGLPAKDIIDLDVECPVGSMPDIISALAAAGYQHQGDQGIPTREAFDPEPTGAVGDLRFHHLYACEADSPELRKHLAFREFLRANTDRAEWLARAKVEAALSAGTRDEYIQNKAGAYEIITRESLEWADRPLNSVAAARRRLA